MTSAVQQLLESFDALPEADRHRADERNASVILAGSPARRSRWRWAPSWSCSLRGLGDPRAKPNPAATDYWLPTTGYSLNPVHHCGNPSVQVASIHYVA